MVVETRAARARRELAEMNLQLSVTARLETGGDKVVIDVGDKDDVPKIGDGDVVKVCKNQIATAVADEAVKGGDDVGDEDDEAKSGSDDVTEVRDNLVLTVVSDKVAEGGADVSNDDDVAKRGGGDVTQVCGNQVLTVVSGENNEVATVDNSTNVVTNGNGNGEMAAGVALNEDTIAIAYTAYEVEPTRISTSARLTLPYSAAATALHHEIERLRAAPPHFHSYIDPLDEQLTGLVRHLIGAPVVAVTSLQQYEYLSDRLKVAIPEFACLHTSPDLAAILLLAASQQIRAYKYV